jgi:peptidoglycan/xylan/chitin deacetylase (PgdA/CDA1 family)
MPKLYGLMQLSPSGETPPGVAPFDPVDLIASGITQVQRPPLSLTGQGVILCFIDTGIDYQNPVFLDENGNSRILAIWDQTVQTGAPPDGLKYGSEYRREDINLALRSEDPYSIVPSRDENGHTVGNHTYHHYDMSKISDPAVFRKEMDDVRTLFQETTGTEMAMYYRPPQGKYSETNLQMAKDLGYATFFWSLAYVDWNVDAQPSHEEAFSKLTGRIHPGAVVLLHNTSKTNGEILDELLTKWEEMGYTFGKLEELVQ